MYALTILFKVHGYSKGIDVRKKLTKGKLNRIITDFQSDFSSPLARRRFRLFTPEFYLNNKQKGAGQAGSHSPKQDCLFGESFIRCGQVQEAVRL